MLYAGCLILGGFPKGFEVRGKDDLIRVSFKFLPKEERLDMKKILLPAAMAVVVMTLVFLAGKKLNAVYRRVTGLDALSFHERAVVEESLREDFPGEEPVLSEKYRESATKRSWTFRLKNYPDYSFRVESVKYGDMLPFIYNRVALRNDAYSKIAEALVSRFESRIKENEAPEAAGLWKGISFAGYSGDGFQQDEDEPPHFFVSIVFTEKSEIEKAGKLMNDFYEFLHREAPELSDAGFHITMHLDKKYRTYGGYYLDQIDTGSIYDKKARIELSVWSQKDLDDYEENCTRSLYRYYILMADTGDGVTEEDKAEFAKEYTEIGPEGVHYLKGEAENRAYPQLWLSIRGRNYIAQKSKDGKYLFIDVPEAYQIFSDCGLKLKGDRAKFELVGIDGGKYHFSPELEYGNPGAEINDLFLVDDALVKKICGVDLWESIVREGE